MAEPADKQSPLTGSGPESKPELGRRSYMKLAGAAVAGTLFASGSASAAGDSYALVIDGRGSEQTATYEFEVSESVEASPLTDNTNDTIRGTHVEGQVSENVNAYVVTGELLQISVSGHAAVAFGESVRDLLPEEAPSKLVVSSETEISYEFTIDGEVTKLLDNGKNSAEATNDTITKNDDGTYTVSGYTGNGYGDGYEITGRVTSFTPMNGPYTASLDGSKVSAYDLTGAEKPPLENEIAIVSESEISYEFTTTGEVTKLLDNGKNSAEATNDAITKNDDGTYTVSGYTGNGYGDSYVFTGDVAEFSPFFGPYSIYLNGQKVGLADLPGFEPPETTPADALGGGSYYSNLVPVGDATYTAGSRSELVNALDRASGGDIVYLTDDVTVSSTIRVPRGVTLASDRGINGSAGSKLSTGKEITVLKAGRNSRITGLRLDGPHWRYRDWDGYPCGSGLDVVGNGVEVDNCEIYGFAYTGVNTHTDTRIHHCDIHHNPQNGLGYGVMVDTGHATIEYCTFDYNRHSVAAAEGSCGYTIENCWFGPETIHHVIDHHGPEGDAQIIIRNSTVEAHHKIEDDIFYHAGAPSEAIRIRGDGTTDRTVIENCWFFHDSEPTPPGDSGEAIYLYGGGNEWSDKNATVRNNHFGSNDPGAGIGHPR